MPRQLTVILHQAVHDKGMEDYGIERIVDSQDLLGEGPIWDVERRRLYWTDIDGGRYHLFEPSKGAHRTLMLGVKVGAIGLRERGGLILATQEGFAFHDPDADEPPEYLANPEADRPETRFNDAAVDPGGRFWAGSYGGERNTLYCLERSLDVRAVDSGFGVPNGIGWSLDDSVMYFTDSAAKTIYAYDFDAERGEIENRREFIVTQDESGVPDGLVVDAEGFVWSARFDGHRLERYDPGGVLERTIELEVQCPTSMAFGGPGSDELYVTSATKTLSEAKCRQQPLSGGLIRLWPGVKGRAEPRFKG